MSQPFTEGGHILCNIRRIGGKICLHHGRKAAHITIYNAYKAKTLGIHWWKTVSFYFFALYKSKKAKTSSIACWGSLSLSHCHRLFRQSLFWPFWPIIYAILGVRSHCIHERKETGKQTPRYSATRAVASYSETEQVKQRMMIAAAFGEEVAIQTILGCCPRIHIDGEAKAEELL